ncbi:MAG: 3-phosphoshikimate 1-carboxyvinyltransferase [candidate division NC10 bacterium]|nr:3-phosphoshikimate 1-carboxyvinyltransferase [candidate division NC10 bacterium]
MKPWGAFSEDSHGVSSLTVLPGNTLKGEAKVPGDKSISHRAVILGSLAEGLTEIQGFLPGEDCLRTATAFTAMGVEIEAPDPDRLLIRGKGLRGLAEPEDVLYAGNSGTTMRLMMGVLAGQGFFSVLTGDPSLRRRPMGRVTEPLRRMGASIWGRGKGAFAPLAIRGGCLHGIHHKNPIASAQVKSALLLAGLFADGETVVEEPHQSRDHTERMLHYFGLPLKTKGLAVGLEPPQRLEARALEIPGDFSSAAFLIVAALLVPNSEIVLRRVGVNPTRTGLLHVLRSMGANIEMANQREASGEPVADIWVRSSQLQGTQVGGPLIPLLIDEIPILALAATQAAGKTIIQDAGELRVKESDRIATVAQELSRLGARVQEREDGLVIDGGTQLRGSTYRSHGDHRIAMTLAIAGLLAEGHTQVLDIDCIHTSFPGFAELLCQLGAEVSVALGCKESQS